MKHGERANNALRNLKMPETYPDDWVYDAVNNAYVPETELTPLSVWKYELDLPCRCGRVSHFQFEYWEDYEHEKKGTKYYTCLFCSVNGNLLKS